MIKNIRDFIVENWRSARGRCIKCNSKVEFWGSRVICTNKDCGFEYIAEL